MWKKPELEELDVRLTANGKIDLVVETKYTNTEVLDTIVDTIEDILNPSDNDGSSTTPNS